MRSVSEIPYKDVKQRLPSDSSAKRQISDRIAAYAFIILPALKKQTTKKEEVTLQHLN